MEQANLFDILLHCAREIKQKFVSEKHLLKQVDRHKKQATGKQIQTNNFIIRINCDNSVKILLHFHFKNPKLIINLKM